MVFKSEVLKKVSATKAYMQNLKSSSTELRETNEYTGNMFVSGKMSVTALVNLEENREIGYPELIVDTGHLKLAAIPLGEFDKDSTLEADFGDLSFSLHEHMFPHEIKFRVKERAYTSRATNVVTCLKKNSVKNPEDYSSSIRFSVGLPSQNQCRTGLIIEEKVQDSRFGNIYVKVEYFIDQKNAGNNVDVTKKFRDKIDQAISEKTEGCAKRFSEKYHNYLDQIQCMFVPGLFTQYYPGYYSKNLAWVRNNLNIPAEEFKMKTTDGVEKCALVIKEGILAMFENNPKKIVLFGHSKGGCDIALCLVKYPELQKYVYGVITMQAPYLGSFMIDWVTTRGDNMARTVVERIFGGEKEAYQDLGYSKRKEVTDMYPYDGRKIPTVSLCSSANFGVKRVQNLNDVGGLLSLKFCNDIILKYTGARSDGMVTPFDARFPGASIVVLDNMFHTEPAMEICGAPYGCGPITQSLLGCLIDKVNEPNGAALSGRRNFAIRQRSGISGEP